MRNQKTIYFDAEKQEGCVIREATLLEILAALNFLKTIQANGEQFNTLDVNTLDVALYAHDILKIFQPCLTFFPSDENNIINKLGGNDLMDVINGLVEVNSNFVGKLINSLMALLPKMGLPTPTFSPAVPLNDSSTGSFS